MRFQGGKSRIAKTVAAYLGMVGHDCTTYVEPFMGGGSVTGLAVPLFSRSVVADNHEDLVLMWQAATYVGWEPPTAVTKGEHTVLKDAPASPLRGFVGYACSYGGKWFASHSADVPSKASYFAAAGARRVRERSAAMSTAGTDIRMGSYESVVDDVVGPGAVVYCDPPYVGTAGYEQSGTFDHSQFYAVLNEWVQRGAVVLVSEYTAPPGWEMVWEKPVHISMSHRSRTSFSATERLFMHPEQSHRVLL